VERRRADPALKPYAGKPSGRGGKHKDAWVIRDDRRDRRRHLSPMTLASTLVRVGLVSVVAADGGIPRLARGGLAEQA